MGGARNKEYENLQFQDASLFIVQASTNSEVWKNTKTPKNTTRESIGVGCTVPADQLYNACALHLCADALLSDDDG